MTATAITLEQFLAQPEIKPASEYACGEVTQKPMPTKSHSRLQRSLILVLAPLIEQLRLGEILPEFRCIFGPPGRVRAYVPDLAFVAHERIPAEEYLYGPPDLAIEILSPDQPMAEFLSKLRFYLDNGVQLVWVLDPKAR